MRHNDAISLSLGYVHSIRLLLYGGMTKAPGIAFFSFNTLFFQNQVRIFPATLLHIIARFARDAILTSSAVVLVRYWLVFLNQVRIFLAIFLLLSEK